MQNGIMYKLAACNDYYSIKGFDFNATQKQREHMQRLCIPKTVNGIPVKKIEFEAFKGNLWIESLFIPSTVEYIGHQAFAQCKNLVDVLWMGDSNKTVEMGALVFLNCENLKTVTIHSFLKTGTKTFCKCRNLFNFACGYVDGIPSDYFVGCTSLKTVNFVKCGYLTRSSFMGTAIKRVEFHNEAPKLFDGTIEQWNSDGITVGCLANNPLVDLMYEGIAVDII